MAGVQTGLRDIFFAEIDETAGTFGVPYRIGKAIEASVTSNVSTNTLYADDGASETASSEAATEIIIGIDALTNSVFASLLGKQVSTEGAVISSSSDNSPYGALMFRSLKSNGEYKYLIYYKGSFAQPDSNFTTKGETVEFQTKSLVGTFVQSDTVLDEDGNGIKFSMMDSDDAGADQTAIENWFTTPFVPTFTTP